MPRFEILDNPLSTTSCALKPPVRAKLDSIASATQAIISVVNPDSQTDELESSGKPSSGTNSQGGGDPGAVGAPLMQGSSPQATKGAFGLETERICEIVVEGALGAIEVAKVRLLVMLDELVRSVHSHSRKEIMTLTLLLSSVRSSLRDLLDRLQAAPHHRLSETTCHPDDSGGNGHKYLLPYAALWHHPSHACRFPTTNEPKHRHASFSSVWRTNASRLPRPDERGRSLSPSRSHVTLPTSPPDFAPPSSSITLPSTPPTPATSLRTSTSPLASPLPSSFAWTLRTPRKRYDASQIPVPPESWSRTK